MKSLHLTLVFAFAASVFAETIPAKDRIVVLISVDGLFLASGYGIKPGTNLDVAPTIAELLGIPLPKVDGRVLKEILK